VSIFLHFHASLPLIETNLDCNDESFFYHNIKLTEEQKYLCEGNITFKECAQSLKLMTNGKSPGSDGFTVDFYNFFWEDIGPLLSCC
jgi:hypothetical protein